ncbi:Zn-dependent hydrolase [Hansschlegelia quercus]|uniref:Zn-dependent hydrolase n=1 Tax=Hansschlegelia quercus TaxID=2528245 RepID=A0A4Q9GPW4_9HYPH|nr:Zn-dependent hydrolase [Hansschlegelia quercus]TBN55275.1 Zn-dependent hydrolase [Hansschlegelia quercus]
MPPSATHNLAIDGKRLWDAIHETAAFGGTPKGGVKRLTLSDEDRQVRDWFAGACEAIGAQVAVDDMGNMYARRPGKRNDLPPIALGSHLDTQPTGGKFDGVLGVLGALEVLRTLYDSGYETNAPIEIVNWTNEEGARFAPAMLASGVFVGAIEKDWALNREDRAGAGFGAELERIGYRGEEPCGARKFSAFFELHIEQGPILEAEGKMIGVVTGVQGIRWYEVTLTGQEAHTGSTPMGLRRNALIGAAKLIEAVDRIAKERAPGVGTVGLIESRPNSRNVIPGEVFFTVDFRHPDDGVLDEMEAAFFASVEQVSSELRLEADAKRDWASAPVKFDADCVAAVREAAESSGHGWREIVSGPGHDAAYVARVCPTSMIFTPCRDGISHNEAESITQEEATAGAQALLDAALIYDRRFG